MTGKEAFKYGEILGSLMSLENAYILGRNEKAIIQEAIADMSELFDSLNKG